MKTEIEIGAKMKIELTRPPNFEQILAAFPGADKPGVIFAFGDAVHNPSGGHVSEALIRHESVHCERQLAFNYNLDTQMTPALWWEKYIADHEFRYIEELKAHAAEFTAQLHPLISRNNRARLLHRTAQRLIAPLYNYNPPRTMRDAQLDLKRELDL
jgi:hypothetical protein